MKTITKTFYTTQRDFDEMVRNINDKYDYFLRLSNSKDCLECFYEGRKPDSIRNIEIQISWQEPEKKVEISESELDEKLKNKKIQFQQGSFGSSYAGKEMIRVSDLKEILFGNREG